MTSWPLHTSLATRAIRFGLSQMPGCIEHVSPRGPRALSFVERFNSTVGKRVWGNGTRFEMTEDGTILTHEA
jgi:hypothetical protein